MKKASEVSIFVGAGVNRHLFTLTVAILQRVLGLVIKEVKGEVVADLVIEAGTRLRTCPYSPFTRYLVVQEDPPEPFMLELYANVQFTTASRFIANMALLVNFIAKEKGHCHWTPLFFAGGKPANLLMIDPGRRDNESQRDLSYVHQTEVVPTIKDAKDLIQDDFKPDVIMIPINLEPGLKSVQRLSLYHAFCGEASRFFADFMTRNDTVVMIVGINLAVIGKDMRPSIRVVLENPFVCCNAVKLSVKLPITKGIIDWRQMLSEARRVLYRKQMKSD